MLIIYTPDITPRLSYIVKFLLSRILDLNYEITSDIEYYQNSAKPKLTYSDKPFQNEPFITAHNLLFETNIEEQKITISKNNDFITLFENKKNDLLLFDVFAASFYLISRYEEYTCQCRDEHDRFKAEQSFAFKNNFLDQPIVDQWAFLLKEKLTAIYPTLEFTKRTFNYIPTFDIDQAFAIQQKGSIRITSGILKSLLKINLKDVIFRIRVLRGKKPDPFNTFSIIKRLNKQKKIKPYFFFLLGKYGKYDKNISPNNTKFKRLVSYFSKNYITGIHPSYVSHKNIAVLQCELSSLESITQKKITHSRQHFLRISFPETFQNLIKAEIKNDFSLGYASQIGFRASTCTPFFFYDLTAEKETNLVLFPFCVMDVTLKNYMNLTTEQSIEKITKLVNTIKSVNGTFISLWHNESLSNHGEWKNWQEVYKQMLEITR